MNRPNFAGERSRKLGKSWTAGRGEGGQRFGGAKHLAVAVG